MSIHSTIYRPRKSTMVRTIHAPSLYDELGLKLRDMLSASGIEPREPADTAGTAEPVEPVEAAEEAPAIA